jgi:hypothetical protein
MSDKSRFRSGGVQSDIDAEWVIEAKQSSSVTVEANGAGHVEIPTTKEGYTAKGIVGIDSFSSAICISSFSISTGHRAYIYYKNTANASLTGKYGVYVLYKKN